MANLISRLMERARNFQGSVALPESLDPRILAAAQRLLKEKLVREVFLFGDPQTVLQLAKRENISLSKQERGIVWVNEALPKMATELSAFHCQVLQTKGKPLPSDGGSAFALHPLNQAGYLLHKGGISCVVAGCVETTAAVIRASLATVGTATGIRTVSGSFLMHRSHSHHEHNYIYADAGVVIDPTSEQLVDIAAASVATAQQLIPEQEPVVAFLSFSTKGSAQHPMADKVIIAFQQFRAKYPNVAAEGEIQFDAAIDAAIGARKCPGSLAAGRANIFIFPNLDAGNIAYKMTQRLAGFSAFGPILQGTARPYSDLSRGASVDDIVMMACINVLRAQ